MAADFIVRSKGLVATATVLSEVPSGSTPVWDFGVSGQTKSTSNTYTYTTSDRYKVSLYYRDANNVDTLQGSKYVMVSAYAKTQLRDYIYILIDTYIPKNINQATVSLEDKEVYIIKWQLYIQPLVNHTIPIEEYSNEFYYEALENQLIMELAAYDYIYAHIEKLITSTTQSTSSVISSSAAGTSDNIKQITTGPTEVQYYEDLSASVGSVVNSISNLTKPGGVLDDLRKNICMLAKRLDIYLPICDPQEEIKVPRVVNHRKPGPLDGPNPSSLLTKK